MKSKIAIPSMIALVAVIALALPPAMAESGSDMHGKYKHDKHHKMMEVVGFVGTIEITEDSNRHELKEKVTVSLSDAASEYPEAMKAKIAVVQNESGSKYLVWKIVEKSYDHESHILTKTIHIVDAANAENTTTIVKEIDKMQKKIDKIDKKIDRVTEKISQSSGNPEKDELREEFLATLQQLRDALSNGDSESVKDLRQQLKDIRTQLADMRRA